MANIPQVQRNDSRQTTAVILAMQFILVVVIATVLQLAVISAAVAKVSSISSN